MKRKHQARFQCMFFFLVGIACIGGTFASEAPAARPHLTFSTVNKLQLVQVGENILRTAYDRIGYDIQVLRFPSERALIMANSGKTDGDLGRVETLVQYPNLIRVDEPLFALEAIIYQKKNLPRITSFAQLDTYRVTYLRGLQLFSNRLFNPRHILANNPHQLFRLLDADRVDFVIHIAHMGDPALDSHLYPGIKPQLPPMLEKPIYHYLNQKHRHLVPLVQEQLVKMKQNGELQEITDNFFATLPNAAHRSSIE